MSELAVEPVFDLLLGQHEEADGDEEARPGAEVEQKRVRVRRPEGVPRNEAQDERNAPGQRDEYRGATAGEQRVLAQHPEPPLQFEKRPAVRGQIFPDPARFVLIRVYADGDICSRSQIRHVPEPFHPRSQPLP